MLKFSDCRNANDPSIYVLVAQVDVYVVGSVAVKEWPGGDISVARLFTRSEYRRCGIARWMMQQIFRLYPGTDMWLYAMPYTRTGANAEALVKFYMSLGFQWATDDDGRPVMVRRQLWPRQ